ncbi:hypothetical protein MAM1_0582c10964 [Mucor ambiguus]|uniref:Uncharacterized protein n=1 Tax=Mucor ambiguus TaxID=91626 RepID=A0A0C9N5R2_9FUNG|nr:hypothetical protein MAM1_0582c10964 [Mucor ambiguus]
MEAIVPFIFENIDILLAVFSMLYPLLSILWESYVIGFRIEQQRAGEAATFQNLVTQVDQTARKIDQLQSQTVAKNLLKKNQLEAIVKSNASLGHEVEYLRSTVDEEQTAIKELTKHMNEKNRLVDALVIIMRDLQQGLRLSNADQALLSQNVNNIFVNVNSAKRDIQIMEEAVVEIKTSVTKNAETNFKQFKDIYTKLIQQQKSTDAFKAWAEGVLKTFISNPPAGDANKDISALKVELKHTKEYINVMRDNFTNNSCECGTTMGPRVKQFEDALKEQRKAIKDILENYNEFRDDYYMSENFNGNAIQKVMETMHQSYATREEIHEAFQQIHDDIVAAQCNCKSANTQHQQQEQQQQDNSAEPEREPDPEGMAVDP